MARKASVQKGGGVLVGQGRSGDIVHETQEMGGKMGFRNVSQHWLDTGTLDFDAALARLSEGRAQIEDIEVPFTAFEGAVNDAGQFVFRHEGREFVPTTHALTQYSVILGLSTWETALWTSPIIDSKSERIIRKRDAADSEVVKLRFSTALRDAKDKINDRKGRAKDYLFRTQIDGTLRAVLSRQYAILDNRFLLKTLSQVVPTGRVSHWKNDGDHSTLSLNILIPDSIRDGGDSDYGAMLSTGNSEIGRKSLTCVPSLFRAICMNGCIWDQVVGKKIKQVHRGGIDYVTLRDLIRNELNKQIPLVGQGIELLLGTKQYRWDGAKELPVFSVVNKRLGLSKKDTVEAVEAWREEEAEHGDLARTGFGIIAAITRSGRGEATIESTNGHRVDADKWVRRDQQGGELLKYDADDWNHLFAEAKRAKAKDVLEAFPAGYITMKG